MSNFISRYGKNLVSGISAGLIILTAGILWASFGRSTSLPNSFSEIQPPQFKSLLVILVLLSIGYAGISVLYRKLRPTTLFFQCLRCLKWLEQHFFIGLFLLLVIKFIFLTVLEGGHTIYNYSAVVFPELVGKIDNYHWWVFFIPGYEWEGAARYGGYYSPLSMILILYMPTKLGPQVTWFLLSLLLVPGTFLISWFALRSRVFSYSLTILMGFGTHFFHTYHVPATMVLIPQILLIELSLLFVLKIFTDQRRKTLWQILFIVEIIFLAMYNLAWLDYVVIVWVLSLALFAFFLIQKKREYFSSVAVIFGVTTVVGLLYFYLKMALAGNQVASPGAEEDVIFNYPHLLVAVEDLISNLITNFFIAVSNFLPPFISGSNSQVLFGSEKLIEMQDGYHVDYTHLIPMQHFFFWRYYAGMWFAGFVFLLVNFLKKAFQKFSVDHLVMSIFILMVFFGSATHLIIKARPYMSAPILAYRVILPVLGVALLISYLLMMVWRDHKNQKVKALIIGGVWALAFIVALTRPAYIEFYTEQVGIAYRGPGPDPMGTLIDLARGGWRKFLVLIR